MVRLRREFYVLVQQHFLLPQTVDTVSVENVPHSVSSPPSPSLNSPDNTSTKAEQYRKERKRNMKGSTGSSFALHTSPSLFTLKTFPDSAFIEIAVKIKEEEMKAKMETERRKLGGIEFEKSLKNQVLKRKNKKKDLD
jgi:hypothetical protein